MRHLQDGALGDEPPVDDGAALRHEAVDARGEGRVDPEGLVEHGEEVGEFGHGGEVDLVFTFTIAVGTSSFLVAVAGVGLADFALQAREFVRVTEEVVHGDGEQRGRGLAAGHDEDVGVGVQLVGRDAARLIDVLRETGHEVRAVRLARQAPVDLVAGRLGVRDGLGPDFLGHEHLKEGAEAAHGEDHLPVHHHGEVGEDEGDPGVELPVLDAVERLAEGQVPDDVEGEVVEPGPKVDDLAAGGALAEPPRQQGGVPRHDGLLGLERGLGEGGAQDLAVTHVLGVRLEPGEARGAEHARVVLAEGRLRGHGLLAPAVAVDVAQGRGRGVGQLVGREAHHGPVPLVQLEHRLVDVALDLLDHLGEVGAAVEERAREACQGVEVHIVDELAQDYGSDLDFGVVSGVVTETFPKRIGWGI